MELFADLLGLGGHIVYQAKDAKTGINVARQIKPDLILIDIALPDMDGLAATAILKNDIVTKAIPVVALTAHAMLGDRERALNSGCSGYITKPIDTRKFVNTVVAFIETTSL